MANKIPVAYADVELQVSVAIAVGDTSFTLSSANDDDGNALPAGLYCFTIDNATSAKEYLIGQLNGTNVTSVKSVSRQGVETTGAARKHRIGASVLLTDFATIQRVADILRGIETLDGASPLVYDAEPTLADRKELATVGYVLDAAFGGAITFDQQVIAGNGGESIVAGNLVYFNTADQEWYKTDADTAATVEGVQLGIALGTGSDGVAISGGIQISGTYTTSGLTAGASYYASNTAGAIASSAGTTSQIVGLALSTTKLLIIPRNPQTLSTNEKAAAAGGGDLGVPSGTNRFITETGFPIILEDIFDAFPYPTVAATATSSTLNSTAITATLPSGITAGNLLIVVGYFNGTITVQPVGWTLIGATGGDLAVYAKIAAGGDTFSATFGSSVNECATISYRITDFWGSDDLTDIVKARPNDNIEANQTDPFALNPDNIYTHYLWVTATGWTNTGSVSTPPTGWGSRIDSANAGSGSDRCTISAVSKTSRAIYEDPEAWSGYSGTTSNRDTITFSVRRASHYTD